MQNIANYDFQIVALLKRVRTDRVLFYENLIVPIRITDS